MDEQTPFIAHYQTMLAMLQNILAILTTNAVVLHALLGCCAHDVHASGTHQLESAAVAAEDGDDHQGCSHHRSHEHSAPDDPSEDGHQQHGDHGPCDESDCHLVSVRHSDDISLGLSLEMWLAVPGDAVAAETLNNSLSLLVKAVSPPGSPLSPQSLQQVWLL